MRKKRKRKESNRIYKGTMLLMALLLGAMLYLINDEKQIVTTQSIQNFKWTKISDLMFWENFFPEDEKVVTTIKYQQLENHYYSNGTNIVNVVSDGVVLKVDKSKVIVLCDNGISITYDKLKSINIKKDERVLVGDALGTMKDKVELHFYSNDKELSMNEALAIK